MINTFDHYEYICGKDVALQVTYKTHGKYIPETRFQPAEYPEVELVSVKLDGHSFNLTKKQVDYMTTLCEEDFRDQEGYDE